jgi:diketogulonate reductase-like aldo/keto reductase
VPVPLIPDAIGVGFGTAALGGEGYNIVLAALDAGFRKFDTAEADWWYDQKAVGKALESFFDAGDVHEKECLAEECSRTCFSEGLQISTKIPPWSLTSEADIRMHARESRQELVGFCEDAVLADKDGNIVSVRPYPLDVYFIHSPKCYDGWHPRCKDPPEILSLRDAWVAMEAVVGLDYSSRRIGLSNVSPNELLDVISFVKERKEAGEDNLQPPPRMPDAVQAFADPLHPAKELRRICKEHGIEFVSYSTLGTQHRSQINPVLGSEVVKTLAETHGRSVAEVVLSWALQNDMSVIPRSTKKHHIAELANLLTLPPFLSATDLSLVDSLSLN